jgi:hypothetical protein
MASSYSTLRRTSDGVVVVRPSEPGEASVLIAGRDGEFHRWLGAGDDDPPPSAACVAYVDCDLANDREQIEWLWLPGQRETWQAMSVHLLRLPPGAPRPRLRESRRAPGPVFPARSHERAPGPSHRRRANAASRRVAAAVGAEAYDSLTDECGRTMIRHVIQLERRERPVTEVTDRSSDQQ